MATEAQKKALEKYKAKVNRFTVDFPPSDTELWEHLQKQPKKQTYIKGLIRADMDSPGNNADLQRLLAYLTAHEDADEALKHNAGLDEYPSVIIESLVK